MNLISTFLKQASMLKLYPKKMAHMSAFDAISNKVWMCYRNYSEKLAGYKILWPAFLTPKFWLGWSICIEIRLTQTQDYSHISVKSDRVEKLWYLGYLYYWQRLDILNVSSILKKKIEPQYIVPALFFPGEINQWNIAPFYW